MYGEIEVIKTPHDIKTDIMISYLFGILREAIYSQCI